MRARFQAVVAPQLTVKRAPATSILDQRAAVMADFEAARRAGAGSTSRPSQPVAQASPPPGDAQAWLSLLTSGPRGPGPSATPTTSLSPSSLEALTATRTVRVIQERRHGPLPSASQWMAPVADGKLVGTVIAKLNGRRYVLPACIRNRLAELHCPLFHRRKVCPGHGGGCHGPCVFPRYNGGGSGQLALRPQDRLQVEPEYNLFDSNALAVLKPDQGLELQDPSARRVRVGYVDSATAQVHTQTAWHHDGRASGCALTNACPPCHRSCAR